MPTSKPRGARKGGKFPASSPSAANSEEDDVSSVASTDSRALLGGRERGGGGGGGGGAGGARKGGGKKRGTRLRGASSDSLESLDSRGWGEKGDGDPGAGCEEGDGRTPPDWKDELRLLVSEGLTEKRTSTREASLERLANLLCHHVAEDQLADHRLTLTDALKRSVKRESKESVLASKALAAMFASIGPGNDDLLSDVAPSLRATILSDSPAPARAEAIRALGVASFVNHTLSEEIGEVLSLLQRLLDADDSSGQVHVAALDMHGLLFAALPQASDARQVIFDRTMDSHMCLVGSNNADARIAAGENVAIMYELLEENGDGVHYNRHEELLDLMAELANESGKQKSRKEKQTQRAAFRSMVSFVDRREKPTTKLQFRNQTVHVGGFARLRQLNTFKEIFGEGLHVHFTENSFVQEVFGVDFGGRTAGKVFRTGTDSRARTRDIKAGRADKARESDLMTDY